MSNSGTLNSTETLSPVLSLIQIRIAFAMFPAAIVKITPSMCLGGTTPVARP